MRRILAGVIILAVPASAQNTNCQLYGSSVNCQTTQPPKGVDWRLATQNQNEPDAAPEEVDNARRHRATAQRAGKLAADGRCDEAKALALRMGEFQIARDVASVCTK